MEKAFEELQIKDGFRFRAIMRNPKFWIWADIRKSMSRESGSLR